MQSKSFYTRSEARALARALRAEGARRVTVVQWDDFWLVWWYE